VQNREALKLKIAGLQNQMENYEREFNKKNEEMRKSMEAYRTKIQTLQQQRARLLQQQEEERREREKRQAELADLEKRQEAERARLVQQQEAERARFLQQPAAKKIKVEREVTVKPEFPRRTRVFVCTYVPLGQEKYRLEKVPAIVNRSDDVKFIAEVCYTDSNFTRQHPTKTLEWVHFEKLEKCP